MIDNAIALVTEYLKKHVGKDANFTLFVCWQATILQNFKCLIRTTLPWDMYFEVTYDGDMKCWYFDAYKKVDNREIPDAVH